MRGYGLLAAAVLLVGAPAWAVETGAAGSSVHGGSEKRPTPASRPGTGMGTDNVGGKSGGYAGIPSSTSQVSGAMEQRNAKVNPGEGSGPVRPMRFVEVPKADPLTHNTMDSPGTHETPRMAGSTGLWGWPEAYNGPVQKPPR